MVRMKLHYAPASSYSQRVVIGLCEKGASYLPIPVDLFDEAAREAYLSVNPFGRIPSLELADGRILFESIVILDYLDLKLPEPPLLPEDPSQMLEARFLERVIDLYVNRPRNLVFHDLQKDPDSRGGPEVEVAYETLRTACDLLNKRLSGRTWLAGQSFSIADCAAAPTLQYLRLVLDFDHFTELSNYADRLAQRPSCAQAWTDGLTQLREMLKGLPYPLDREI